MVNETQKESKPPASREEEIYLTILRTAEVLSWGVIETLKRADLTPTQYNALRILRGAEPEGASCREVGERMVTKESDITRLLNRLEHRTRLLAAGREPAMDIGIVTGEPQRDRIRMPAHDRGVLPRQFSRRLGQPRLAGDQPRALGCE